MEPPPTQLRVSHSPTIGTEETLRNSDPSPDSDDAWRDELSARLHRYRSRRKAAPPRYPSLRLPFDPAAPAVKPAPLEQSTSDAIEPVPDYALEPDGSGNQIPNDQLERSAALPQSQPSGTSHGSQAGTKIIEFPRFAWGPPPPPSEELAEPVFDQPRILEVPEVAPPPPALGGIIIESVKVAEPEKRPGIDMPLQGAPLGRRLLASAIDVVIISAASALFGFVFWKVALVRPPQIQLLSLATGVPCVFWAAYQYLLIVYAGSTPGLRLARLQLTRFDGMPARRCLRRWRVLASYLSAASLGMGYAWLFLDEDGLCWHDRITHTYLAPRKPN